MDLKKVIAKIKPKKVEYESFLNSLNSNLKKSRVNAKAVLGGSLAKGTYLNNPDIDIFVKFDQSYRGKDISSVLEKIIKPLKPVRIHGSRDYFRIKDFEIVPVLNCADSSEIENVTDMSPLHVEWISKNIKNLQDDIRLVKQFCRANNVYGAESYINGFSGYILEILTIHYGSFGNFIKNASAWKPKVIIDVENHYKDSNDILKKLNEAKIMSPIIIIDPVQPERNVAAAVSMEKFGRLIVCANKFLSKPSEDFFVEKNISLADIKKNAKKNGSKLYVLKIKALDGNADVAGTKLLKAFEFIKKQFEVNDFRVLDSGWNFDMFWFELFESDLPKMKKHFGPLVWVRDANVDAFIKKHGQNNIFVENEKLAVFVPRKFSHAKKLLSYLIKQAEVKDRVRSVRC